MGTYYDVVLAYQIDGVKYIWKIISVKGEGFPFDLWKGLRSIKDDEWKDQTDFYNLLGDRLLEEPLEEYVIQNCTGAADARLFITLHVIEKDIEIQYTEREAGSDSGNHQRDGHEEPEPGVRVEYSGWMHDPDTTDFFVGYALGPLNVVTDKY